MTQKIFAYGENESEGTRQSFVYLQRLNVSFTVPETKDYWIIWYAEIRTTSSQARVEARARLDDSETLNESEYEPESSSQWWRTGGRVKRNLSAGSRKVDIDYRMSFGDDEDHYVKIRRARIFIEEIR